MKELLWLSYCAPYDLVGHAGGKVHNYYLKSFHKSGDFDIRLISFCYSDEVEKLDLDKYGIHNKIFVLSTGGIKWVLRNLFDAESIFSPFNRYAGVIPNYQAYCALKQARIYARAGYSPDIIILQWTQMVLLIPHLKKLFPKSQIVAIEEDVTFLAYERRWKFARGVWGRKVAKYKFIKEKKLEIQALKQADCVVLNNEKDAKLVWDNGISKEKSFVSVSYFTNYSGNKRHPENKNILFFGSMIRPENHLSAMWFIEKVLPFIADEEVTFVVVGGSPREELIRCQSERVKVMGFVEDVAPFFETCLCMAAPLVLGAGIKIKVLEGLSAGIPVLTNHIGIEGIPAQPGEEYLHCETSEDYVKAIDKLLAGMINFDSMEKRAKTFINTQYSPERKTQEFIKRVNEL